MNKAFPLFGQTSKASIKDAPLGSTWPRLLSDATPSPKVIRNPSRKAIFVPLLVNERRLQLCLHSYLLSNGGTSQHGLSSMLQSQHAQVSSMIYILSQQYELDAKAELLAPTLAQLPISPCSKMDPRIICDQAVSTLILAHRDILVGIEALARCFRGTVRDSMVLGHIAQRHREMASILENQLSVQ